MIIWAILFLFFGVVLGLVVTLANSMSPSETFEGAWIFLAPLSVSAACFAIWFLRLDLSVLVAVRP